MSVRLIFLVILLLRGSLVSLTYLSWTMMSLRTMMLMIFGMMTKSWRPLFYCGVLFVSRLASRCPSGLVIFVFGRSLSLVVGRFCDPGRR